jgi:hypothetical protein
MKLYTDKQIEEIKSKAASEAISKYSKELQDEYNAIENAIKAREECPASFDFNGENINVFSVERMEMPSVAGVPNRNERTLIGYTMLGENNTVIIKEWSLYCSREDHNKLVAEFNAVKKNSKQEKPASKKSLIKG